MKKNALNLVRIVAVIGLGMLFGFRKDYAVAAILAIVVISEIAALFERPKSKSIRYQFTAEGVQTVRDGFKSIGDEARRASAKIDAINPSST